MLETWYLLVDGMAADPNDVAPDADGVLRYKNLTPVAYGPYGPRSRGMSADDIAAARAAREAPRALDREMKAEPRAKYKTR